MIFYATAILDGFNCFFRMFLPLSAKVFVPDDDPIDDVLTIFPSYSEIIILNRYFARRSSSAAVRLRRKKSNLCFFDILKKKKNDKSKLNFL